MGTKTGPEWVRSTEKRRMDLALTAALLPVGGLAVAIGASLMFLEDRKAPLFAQQRIGRDGTLYPAYKVRTMTDARGADASLGAGDPRATRIGKVLRTLIIDEMPQLVNIIKGDMSLVGPRPLLSGDVEAMRDVLGPNEFREWHDAYISCRPGFVSEFGNESIRYVPQTEGYLRRRAALDVRYYQEASADLDRQIFGTTLAIGRSFAKRRDR